MPDQTTYRKCMADGLTGLKLTKDERKTKFCTLAKTCSGKAKTEEEAKKLCAESAAKPKEEKTKKTRRVKKVDYENIEPIDIEIDGEEYTLSPAEFSRICPCILKPGNKRKAKDAQQYEKMDDKGKEVVATIAELQAKHAPSTPLPEGVPEDIPDVYKSMF